MLSDSSESDTAVGLPTEPAETYAKAAEALLEKPRPQKPPTSLVLTVLRACLPLFKQEPNVLLLQAPVVIVGGKKNFVV